MEPLIYVFIGLAILLILGIALLIRRRRSQPSDEPPPLDLGGSDIVDYTSLPEEEPRGWRDRLAAMPPALRILAGVVALALIGGIIALLLMLTGGSDTGDPLATAVPRTEISSLDAFLANRDEIGVTARTNLPDGTQVAAELTMDGQPFKWYTDESAVGQVNDGRIDLTLERDPQGPAPVSGAAFQVIVSASDRTTASADLNTAGPYADSFFGNEQAVVPTNTPRPTAVPPTAPPPGEPTPEPTPEATPAPTFAATVFNGGNVREQPDLSGRVVGGINAGETVSITEKTENGQWYLLTTVRGERGWASATLLTIDAGVAAQVPVTGQSPTAVPAEGPTPTPGDLTATVFNGGNVREQPNLSGRVVGGINAGERVTLLQKTASGQWYRIRTVRNEEGWVSVTLLTIDAAVRDQVPVAGTTPPTDATTGGTLTATVFNGGNVRSQPSLNGAVVGGINADESVTLLQKTLNGQWYRIRTVRNEEGWVSATLLTVDGAVAAQVPVAQQ